MQSKSHSSTAVFHPLQSLEARPAFSACFVGTRKKWSKKLEAAMDRDEVWAGEMNDGMIAVFDRAKFNSMMDQ